MQDHAADELDVEVALPSVRLAASRTVAKAGTRKSSRSCLGDLFLEFGGAGAQRLVREGGDFRFERIDASTRG